MSDVEERRAEAQAAFEGEGLELPFGIILRKVDEHTIEVDFNHTQNVELFGTYRLNV